MLDKPEDLADKFQAFYRAVEAELRNGSHVPVEEDTSGPQDPGPVGEKEEARIRDVLETIEATLCTLLYDRQVWTSRLLFCSHTRAGYSSRRLRMMPRTTKLFRVE